MNKNRMLFPALAAAAFLCLSCNERMERFSREGNLSFSDFELEINNEVDTKGAGQLDAPEPEDFYISVLDEDGEAVRDKDGNLLSGLSYAGLKSAGKALSLRAGHYVLRAQSAVEVPVCGFDCPVFSGELPVSVVAGETCAPGLITCRLSQCMVSIDYDEGLLASMTGKGKATVELIAGSPLEYAIAYEGGKAVPETRTGYFALPASSESSLVVTFLANVGGKSQKMVKAFSGVKAAQWRQLMLIPMVTPEGTATFDIVIDGYVDDGELLSLLIAPQEEIIGEDPAAPVGDGGITLAFEEDCTMFDDLSRIVVPDPVEKTMDLRLVATVPGGVKSFTVDIETENAAFKSALAVAGGPHIDLVHPSADASVVFEVVPFPHGEDLAGMTEVHFNLSAAQEPISGFEGTHTFHMNVVDKNGCKKTISVTMIIPGKE